MRTAALIIWLLAWLYLLVLIARMVIDMVIAMGRGWRPTGAAAAVAEIIFIVTDPPLKLVRRFVRPIRLGAVALDLALPIVALAVSLLAYVAGRLAGGV
ncbi:MAG: YggT family protein [Bifidobacteriaceae bacterium]|nr:YggT family protein [Bifidobacteriaceae bacterium]